MSPISSRRGLRVAFGVSLALLAGAVSPAFAQDVQACGSDTPEWVRSLAIDPESPAARQYAANQKVRVAQEKELRKIRMQHFGPIKRTEIRQEGIIKLRQYTNPAIYPAMIDIFKREDADVRLAILDHLRDQRTPQGDSCLAWMGVFDDSPEIRAGAVTRLRDRIKDEGKLPDAVRLVVYEGIRSEKEAAKGAAAGLANELNLLQAIPWMIAGQLTGTTGGINQGGGDTGDGALAWILVGTQVAFVSDLTPVVAESAVAFDPQLSVVTEGVILRVLDAAVVSYHTEVNRSLIELTSRAWGQPTRQFGWDVPEWNNWYTNTFLPFQAEKDRLAAEAAAKVAEAK